jgi:ribonucleoside-diphosphate reductase alpha chain
MWNNKDTFNGLSVLPYDNGSYVQAPFTECTKEEYEALCAKIKDIDLTKVIEDDDNTSHSQEVSCAGGKCDIL